MDCYKTIVLDTEKCLIPCKGLYADVLKDDITINGQFGKLIEEYENYKRGYENDMEYPRLLSGISILIKYIRLMKKCLDFKKKSKFHFVEIYFATPTFDRITKDEKANFETKLSTIGGTMGLLTGFSIISGIEIVYFAAKILFRFCQPYFKKCLKGHFDSEMIYV